MAEQKINENNSEIEAEQMICDEFWTQHRTTLIAYETQYVFNTLKPQPTQDEPETKKGRKKNIQYQGGFLFPGREGNKQQSIKTLILSSSHSNLIKLFEEDISKSKEEKKLCEFVKIMLELKHSCILSEFLYIYDIAVREVRTVKRETLIEEEQRRKVVEDIAKMLIGFINNNAKKFKLTQFPKYIKNNQKQTSRYLQVTVYCFLAELFRFQINQHYHQAFDSSDNEMHNPYKKKKLCQLQQIEQ